VGNPVPPGFERTVAHDFNIAAFAPTPRGENVFGNVGRNSMRSRGFISFAPSVFKNFNVTKRLNLQLRIEAFNAFNHPNFAPPISDITSPDFGKIVNTLPSNQRQIQFASRLTF
jgi:hypothetical protein